MAETATLTLTDFLLARIAEDEGRARYDMPHWFDCPSVGPVPFSCTCDLEGRLLAECEAKRRIVERASAYLRKQRGDHADEELQAVVRALALPYTDHPDYREEWKQ